MLTRSLPDGRVLRLEHEGPTGDWIGRVEMPEPRTARHRWLLMVLIELLDLRPGRKPEWVRELIRDASGHDTRVGRRYPCPCCGYLTLTDPPTGTYAICPVCWWEDDNAGFVDLDFTGGANGVSLRQARENFRRYRASDERGVEWARPPRPEEIPPS
jgi:hypothetical protein